MTKKNKRFISPFWNLRPVLGYANWAELFVICGGRQQGKSYSVCDFLCSQYYFKHIPFTWLRLTDRQAKLLLQNNAEKLVDPDIRRRYNLDLVTSGSNVYNVTKRSAPDKNGKTKILKKELFARVYALSTFYQQKGAGYDKDFLNDLSMRYNICIDEFEREKGEKNSFDLTYALVNQLENLVRNTKERMKIFFLGNTLEEASDILCSLNFIPETWGIFKLKKKRAVIVNIEPSEEYKEMRKGSLADILMPNASTFTNKIESDYSLIDKRKLITPSYIIKFKEDLKFTVWDHNIITKFNGEKKPVLAMRPYLNELYNIDKVKQVLNLFDTRCYRFRNLITFKQFQAALEELKPRK